MNTKLNSILDRSKSTRREAEKILQVNGISYDLSEWVTIKEYAKRHNLSSTNVVSNWIERGIVSQHDILEIPEFNSLKLVRDKPYK